MRQIELRNIERRLLDVKVKVNAQAINREANQKDEAGLQEKALKFKRSPISQAEKLKEHGVDKHAVLKELIGINQQDIDDIENKEKKEQLRRLYEERSDKLKRYLAKYTKQEELGKMIFGNEFTLDADGIEVDIGREFAGLNNYYRYFDVIEQNSAEYKAYEKCYKACLYIAEIIENNNHGNEVASRAYKMLVLFKKGENINLKSVDQFIKQHASLYLSPIHDIFQNNIPKYKNADGQNNYNLEGWKRLICKVGMIAIQNLESAQAIEEKIGKAPENRKELENELSKLNYERYENNEALAKLYSKYKIKKNVYDRTLDLIARGQLKIKFHDNIPSVVVDIGKEVNASKAGYYLVRLPAGDLRGLILGHITDCCQSIGGYGDGEKCVIDGMSRQNNGFYVLIKANEKGRKFDPEHIDWDNLEECGHKIMGQGYVWKGKSGNLTFDSWENLQLQGNDSIMAKTLERFGEKAAAKDASISRITIGVGRRTPADIRRMNTTYSECMIEGYRHRDSHQQVEIFVSAALMGLREELRQRTGIEDQNHIISIGQAEVILELNDEELGAIIEHYISFTSPHIMLQCQGKEDIWNIYQALLHLKSHNLRKFELVLSKEAMHAYHTNKVRIKQFINFDDQEKIEVLICYEARRTYETGQVSAQDLISLDIKTINVLISYQALAAYETGQVSAQDLINLDIETINVLISDEAINAYKMCNAKIELLTSFDARYACGTGMVRVQDLIGLDQSKVRLLTSTQAINAYRTGKVSAQDLKYLDKARIELLISDWAINAYRTGKISAQDLIGLDESKVELLISNQATAAFRTGKVSTQDLIGLNELEVELLISNQAIAAYKTGKVSAQDLVGLYRSEMRLLISDRAIKVYKAGKVSVQDLKNSCYERYELCYERYEENEALAKLYHKYKVSERIYDRTLDLIARGQLKIKSHDNIPSVVVDIGKEVNASKAGYYLVRLPAGDLRGLILGDITDCCQSIGSYHSEKCVIDGMSRQNNGFYVLIKANEKGRKFDPEHIDWDNLEECGHKIMGQGYVWKGKSGNFTFDSWENLQLQGNDSIMAKTLERFGEKAAAKDASISRITIDVRGETSVDIKRMHTTYSECMIEGYRYGDIQKQVEIFVSAALMGLKEKLRQRTGIEDQSHIISIRQAEVILELNDEELGAIIEHYISFTSPHIMLQCQGKEDIWNIYQALLHLKSHNLRKFELVLSKEAMHAYHTDKVRIKQFINFDDQEKIEVLICYKTRRIYETGQVSAQDLINSDRAQIELLGSYQAIRAYETGQVSAQDLINLDIKTINVLISDEAIYAYRMCNVTAQDLINLDRAQIELLGSFNACYAYDTGMISVQDLIGLDQSKIRLLISNEAIRAYKTGRVSAQVLIEAFAQGPIGVGESKVRLLLSKQAFIAYEVGEVSAQDLKDLDKARIELLISNQAIAAFKTGKVSVQDLKNLDEVALNDLFKGQLPEQALALRQATPNFIKWPLIPSLSEAIPLAYAQDLENAVMYLQREQVQRDLHNSIMAALAAHSENNFEEEQRNVVKGRIRLSMISSIIANFTGDISFETYLYRTAANVLYSSTEQMFPIIISYCALPVFTPPTYAEGVVGDSNLLNERRFAEVGYTR